MRVVVVTGVSGSGKSVALRALEDAGFYSIDNLPIVLFDKLLELSGYGSGEIEKLALVVDTRDWTNLRQLPARVDNARGQGHEVEVVFLDASNAALERRFSETRRRHPLDTGGAMKEASGEPASGEATIVPGRAAPVRATVREAIEAERQLLEPLREAADIIIDTSELSIHQLKRELNKIASAAGLVVPLAVTLRSFGFKNGAPTDADLLFDVRFIPNPYFVEALRPLTGEDEACATFVLERPETKAFLDHLMPMLQFLIPQYEQEGKAYLTIAFGCTGGQHRSVAIARYVSDQLRAQGRMVSTRHRDIKVAALRVDTPPR